jgi:hypothetical protein
MVGVAYDLGWSYDQENEDGKCFPSHFKCHPVSAFISAKFNPAASNNVSGVTFGLAHKLALSFSLLGALSFTPYEEPSPGFINASVAIVKDQQAAGNSYYKQFDASAMAKNKQDAFDGFSTLFIATNGNTYTPGNPIYQGNVLITHYHAGFLIGVALTPSFRKLLSVQ